MIVNHSCSNFVLEYDLGVVYRRVDIDACFILTNWLRTRRLAADHVC